MQYRFTCHDLKNVRFYYKKQCLRPRHSNYYKYHFTWEMLYTKSEDGSVTTLKLLTLDLCQSQNLCPKALKRSNFVTYQAKHLPEYSPVI